MARNIHDAARLPVCHARQQLRSACSRRIEQYQVVAFACPLSKGVWLEQVLDREMRVADAVALGIGTRLGHERRITLHAQHTAGSARQWQCEIAQPAEKVEHRIVRSGLE